MECYGKIPFHSSIFPAQRSGGNYMSRQDLLEIICPGKIYWYQEKFVLNYDFVGKFTTRAPKLKELQVCVIL
jgi:hypothetical protein